jgi:hypothetical protein
MWVVAEVSWADASGLPKHASATIEDMSVSGACLRVRAPIGVGSRVIVEWHREQFSAVTRNCRSDGTDFLLGVCREANGKRTSPDSEGLEGTAFSEPSRGGNGNQPDLATRVSLGSVPYSSPNAVSPSAPAWTKRNSAADPIRRQLSSDNGFPGQDGRDLESSARESQTRRHWRCPRSIARHAASSRKESYAIQKALSPFLATPAGRRRH